MKNRTRSVGWGGGAGGCGEGDGGSRALREEAEAWVCLWVTGGEEAADVSEEPGSSTERWKTTVKDTGLWKRRKEVWEGRCR